MKTSIITICLVLVCSACAPKTTQAPDADNARAMLRAQGDNTQGGISGDPTIRISSGRCASSALSATKPVVAALCK